MVWLWRLMPDHLFSRNSLSRIIIVYYAFRSVVSRYAKVSGKMVIINICEKSVQDRHEILLYAGHSSALYL